MNEFQLNSSIGDEPVQEIRTEILPIFLSLVIPARNQVKLLPNLLDKVSQVLSRSVCDYEIIVVDNASTDRSVACLKELTAPEGLANLQIYALTKEVDTDTVAWVGLENSLGDFVAVIDPLIDDIEFLPTMLNEAVRGVDVVFVANSIKSKQTFFYRLFNAIFNSFYQSFNGINLAKDAPQYRVLSKKVVNFILQHSQPTSAYRYLPATAGFSRINLIYRFIPKHAPKKKIGEATDRGVRMLVSTTRAPMRIVTILTLFGAVSNFFYSIYVIFIAIFKKHVAEGWVSLSLQQSGMFFLLSLVLLVLGEYILQMASLSNEGLAYHVAQEFTSARLLHREKLNVEEVNDRINKLRNQ